ncbi:protein amnionless-like isoform X2 [Panonychus citri]|uniref:protein amnionless-like isoform X2 n=1 Tax=Panonychus citri TaxID=50023 RepID=UPI00230770D4|nr:protein amnionless-like isoform X2 [Panonychus citri]
MGFPICWSIGLIKIWNLDSNRDESNQWLWNGKLCPKDRIIYPDQSIIYVDKLLPNQQIVLPNNGEIILDDNFDLSQVDDTIISNCQPVDRRFNLVYGDWMDPNRWNQSVAGTLINGAWINNPIPHVDRVPCDQDRVVFPKGSTFQVTVSSILPNLFVGSIEINGIPLDNQEFQSFVKSKTGRYLFDIPFDQSLTIGTNQIDCNTGNGCSCSHRSTKFVNWMCKRVKCKPVTCKNPIQPDGHCCPLCGALITLGEIPNDSDLTKIHNYLNKVWLKRYPGTLGYSSRNPATNSLETIITELELTGQLADRAQSLFNELINHEFDPGFPFKSISIRISDFVGNKSSSSSVTSVIIIIVIIILIVIGLTLYRRHFGDTFTSLWERSAFANSQFTFIRFQGLDESERVGLELGLANQPRTSSEEMTIQTKASSSTRSSLQKSTSALFSITEEKVPTADESINETSIEATITTIETKSIDSVELETDLEPRSTHDKALLLDVISLEQD